MFAIPGILALVLFIYVRPQEIFLDLQRLPLLYLFFAVAIFGFAVDLRLRINKLSSVPQLPWAIGFFAWAVLSVAHAAPDQALPEAIQLVVPIALFALIALSFHSFRGLRLLAGLLVALAVFLAALGIHQAHAPLGCVAVDPKTSSDLSVGVPDGRGCEVERECYRNDPEPGVEYNCERIGLLGTTSVNDRVRYRGVFEDPNVLAAALGMAVALMLCFLIERRTPWRVALAAVMVTLCAVCIYHTRSRSGQLGFVAAIGVYALRRYRWKAVLIGVCVVIPVLSFLSGGGEGRADAASSTAERMGAWMRAIELIGERPLLGVGLGQFTDYYYLTAHQSFLLACAELGFFGLFLWTMVLYTSIKIPLVALSRYARDPAAHLAVTWAYGLLAAFASLVMGAFFLSLTYHEMFWIYCGLSGAFYVTVRSHDPEFKVTVRFFEVCAVAAGSALLVGLLAIYLRLRGD